jgi:hypothetical protein
MVGYLLIPKHMTNLTSHDLLQWAYDLVPQPKGLIVDAILDLRLMS